ncbi:male sterility protein-domain-containing protein [Xylaria curta]|nr:male sterility protein-domain-containing protein [Xylaria curta]
MIWFFPEGEIPITSNNIEQAIGLARESGLVPVKYFSSVPYVLQMLAEAEGGSGVEILKSMELVGVGGAPLPSVVGDKLVKSGVKLLSRMGSVECGFLMSSHRQYSNDSEWQYLKAISDPKLLDFEPQEDGLSELVVKPGWPLRLKTNREDGSYATADLFEPHPWIPNTWRYHGRKDALIILANGKKFDPSPIEDELRYSNVLLQDVLVFGTGRSYPGALLFTNCRYLSNDQCLEKAWLNIRTLNSLLPQPSRLPRQAIVIVQVEKGEDTLPRSSKGTILRRQAESRYAEIIDKVYTSPRGPLERAHISEDELVPFISGLFREVLGRQIDPEEDVYAQGVDSIDCVYITKQIQDTLFSSSAPLLPQNVIYDNGTILELANTLKRIREGGDCRVQGHEEGSVLLMRRLVQKFSDVDISGAGTSRKDVVVVLTGASGMLGVHILDRLIDDSRVSKVYCLLRGKTRFAAEERIVKALVKRKLRSEKELRCSGPFQNMICLPCDLSAPYLGLSDKDRLCITNEATHIVHSAWTVNFSIGLKHFETQLANTRNLIDIANASGAEFFFISSTAAVCNMVSKTVPEKISSEPKDASALGYSKSKWVAEQICAAARSKETETSLKGSCGKSRVSIIRVGQLCGNDSGIWNAGEAYPLLLSTAKVTSCLPDLPGKCLDWLPVDIAAKSIMEIALPCNENIAAQSYLLDVPVYHVLNHHQSPSWRQMLDWFLKEPGSIPFNIVSASTWMELLEAALEADPPSKYPWQALMGMWKRQYVLNESDNSVASSTKAPTFEVGFTQHVSQSIHSLKPLSRERLVLMWAWVQGTY